MPRKEAVVVIDGNLIFGRTREGEFAARGGEGIEFEEFSGRNEIKNPSWLFERQQRFGRNLSAEKRIVN